METTKPSEQKKAPYVTQLLCESYVELKPPMSAILNETWVAEITGSSIYKDGVLVTGQLTHTIQYLHPHGQKSNEDKNEDNDQKRSTETEQTESFHFRLRH